jgi:hypothetical protein
LPRELSNELEYASQSEFFRLLFFVDLAFDSGTLHVHNGLGQYTFGGNTYTGLGDFGFIEPIEEGAELSPYSISIGLSGIDDALKASGINLLDTVMGEDIYMRPVTIYTGAIGSDGDLLGDPAQHGVYFMDVPEVMVGTQNVVRVTCESEMAIFDRSNNSRYTDADLQTEYPGDLGFEFLDQMVEAKVVWRGRNTSTAPATPGGRDTKRGTGDAERSSR